jgi:hypothetical protein
VVADQGTRVRTTDLTDRASGVGQQRVAIRVALGKRVPAGEGLRLARPALSVAG